TKFKRQVGYIGFMLDHFRHLRADGRLVFVCLHPTASWQLEILEEICERFIFVEAGQLTHAASMAVLRDDERFRRYIGGVGGRNAPQGFQKFCRGAHRRAAPKGYNTLLPITKDTKGAGL